MLQQRHFAVGRRWAYLLHALALIFLDLKRRHVPQLGGAEEVLKFR
jgi:hypothetical protein